MEMLSGPRVVSPPINGQAARAANPNRPSAKPCSQAASAVGSASASVKPTGRAPMAARSDRLTASALWPMAAGSVPSKK